MRFARTPAVLVVAAVLASVGRAAAQDAPPAPPQGSPSASAQRPAATGTSDAFAPVSPTGAMIRAFLVPGWGHVSIGSYRRGGFYFAMEAITAYAFIRTRQRLGDTRERAALRESYLRGRLATEGVTDPTEIQTRLDGDGPLESFQDLIGSRESQQEDLLAFGIFLVFLSGADAFVSAHLSDFPTPLEVQILPGATGGAELSMRVPLPR